MRQFVILIVTLSISCSTTNLSTRGPRFDVEVDSYSDGNIVDKKACFIYVADSTINQSDLQFLEFLKYVKKSLIENGYAIEDSIDNANIVVLFNYGISDPKTISYQSSVPVWGQTGISKSTTTGTVNVSSYSNSATYSQQTTNQPSYGVTGYRPTTRSYTVYNRYINLVAYDFDYFLKNNKEKRIWQTQITSVGSSGDLRLVFPIMLVGAKPWIGKSTGSKLLIKIYENDPKVIELKQDSN